MKKPQNFFQRIKYKTLLSPSPKTDISIKKMAENDCKNTTELSTFPSWIWSGAVVAACLILLVTRLPLNSTQPQIIGESPEMIQYYESIELMVDSSELNDADWVEVKGGGRP